MKRKQSVIAAAVIVAAGRSKRMGRLGDKAWLRVAGTPVLFYSIRAFLRAGIRRIVVAVRPEDVARIHRRLHPVFGKCIRVVAGGAERQDSVYNGIVASGATWVLVHDAARPAVSPALIRRVLRGARKTGACIPAVPLSDTIKRVHADAVVCTEDRAQLRAVQTPQVFRGELLRAATDAARKHGRVATDCSSLVEKFGRKVSIVVGDPHNIKLTYPGDMDTVKSFLR